MKLVPKGYISTFHVYPYNGTDSYTLAYRLMEIGFDYGTCK